MKQLSSLLSKISHSPELKRKLLFTAMILFVFRVLTNLPAPGVDVAQLKALFAGNQFFSFFNMFSGGSLSNFSIVAVGINPYITASIILQLSAMVFPKLKELQKDGEAGRERMNQYTRLMSVPLAVVQSISVLALLRSQSLLQVTEPLPLIALTLTLVAGAMILMWLGELVSEYGLGNGISLILLAGIVSQFPSAVDQVWKVTTQDQMLTVAAFGVLFLVVIGVVVFMTEAIRKVQIEYAKRVRGSRVYGGQSTHLPIKVNVAGVMPIIFAVSLMLVPPFIGRLLLGSGNTALVDIGQKLSIWFAPTSVIYMLIYFIIVFAFTFFSALVFFNAEDISSELKKSGAFVPGVRPGAPTKKFLEFVVTRITLVGALFLGAIAVLPSIAQASTGIQSLAIGGTSVLIVVSVILETSKQVESMLVGQHYDRYI